MAEAARLVEPNLKRSTVNSIIRTFRQENRINRKPHSGGRGRVLTDQQELAVVEMVRARNDIRLSEIKQAIEENNDTFANVASISLPTVACLLKRYQVSMKHIYLVPFERNNDRVKQLRAEYVQRVMVLDADVNHHKYVFVDEAGFNLAKTRRRRRNIIGQRATVQVPGQRGGNISMCAAISEDGVLGRRPLLGSYNATHLIEFLNEIELACQAWRWKVYDRHPLERATLLQGMDDACDDINSVGRRGGAPERERTTVTAGPPWRRIREHGGTGPQPQQLLEGGDKLPGLSVVGDDECSGSGVGTLWRRIWEKKTMGPSSFSRRRASRMFFPVQLPSFQFQSPPFPFPI
ncbi:uncharacterized protein LOC114839618 [Esox lucius]|uniref:uncharacterized protein LOC114839618 n=1 Tax=Esox lucius TaxID=8010 RepID=UPI001476C746|nr:uncharacterized protein LOC114839618 [Esox lucius]